MPAEAGGHRLAPKGAASEAELWLCWAMGALCSSHSPKSALLCALSSQAIAGNGDEQRAWLLLTGGVPAHRCSMAPDILLGKAGSRGQRTFNSICMVWAVVVHWRPSQCLAFLSSVYSQWVNHNQGQKSRVESNHPLSWLHSSERSGANWSSSHHTCSCHCRLVVFLLFPLQSWSWSFGGDVEALSVEPEVLLLLLWVFIWAVLVLHPQCR